MMIIFHLITIFAAYLYATFLEWAIHKHILHGLGKDKNSWFSFHWHSHHKNCKKYGNLDKSYDRLLSFPVRREILGLYVLVVIHLPIYFLLPYFYYTLIVCTLRYFYVHQKSHRDIKWAKKNIPWHYEHHMGKNQDSNWGVTTDIWDVILNTKRRQ